MVKYIQIVLTYLEFTLIKYCFKLTNNVVFVVCGIPRNHCELYPLKSITPYILLDMYDKY